MKLDGSIALFQYWNRLRDGRPAPKRTEIEPADIKTLLADTFILEKDARGEAVFRLAGTRLCAIYGRELKGFAFASLWKEKDQRHDRAAGAQRVRREVRGGHRFSRASAATAAPTSSSWCCCRSTAASRTRAAWAPSTACEKPFWLGADPIVEAQHRIRFASSIRTASRCS